MTRDPAADAAFMAQKESEFKRSGKPFTFRQQGFTNSQIAAEMRGDPFAKRGLALPSEAVQDAGYEAPTKAAFAPSAVPTQGVQLLGTGDIGPTALDEEQKRAAANVQSLASSARGNVAAASHARQFGTEAAVGGAQGAGMLAQARAQEELRRQMAPGQAELAAMAARRGMAGQEFGYNMGEREAIQQMLNDRRFAQTSMRGELGRGLSGFATSQEAANYMNESAAMYGDAQSRIAAQQRQRQMAAAIGTAGGTALGAAVGGPPGALVGGAVGGLIGTATSDWW
jgi:hypothetical protein